MNVVWHDHERMEHIVPKNAGVVLEGFYYHVCKGRLAEVDRTIAAFVQQSIHGGKRLSGGQRVRWERPV